MISRRAQLLVAALTIVVAAVAYSNAFSVPFQFDDDAYVVNNPVIRSFHYFLTPFAVNDLAQNSPTSFPEALRYAFITRIMGYLSLAINYHLNGLNVAGYHLVNLLLHIANSWLIALILWHAADSALLRAGKPADRDQPYCLIPLFTALIFVSHPIQTHAVTYITSRFVLLAAFFYLSSLLAYIKFASEKQQKKRWIFCVTSIVSAVAAMLTKEFTFTLPIIAALYDVSFLTGGWKDRVKRLLPIACTLPVIPALVFFQNARLDAIDATIRTITAANVTNIPRTSYLFTQFVVIIKYLSLLFFPVSQNVDHDVTVYRDPTQWPVIICGIALSGIFLAALYIYFRSRKYDNDPELKLAAFGILWFFITISIESSVIPLGELIAEYRLYLPSAGIIVSSVSLAFWAARKCPGRNNSSRKVFLIFLGSVVVLFSIATFERNRVWRDEISLWEDAARKSPLKLRPHQNLGTYYSMKGRLEDARRELSAALAIDPGNFELHNNLGTVYRKLGDYNNAVRQYQIVLDLMPGDGMAYFNLGNLFLARGNLPEAISNFQASLRALPDYDDTHNNLGIAFEKSGRHAEALAEFRKALSLNPENDNARNNYFKITGKTE